MTCNFDIAVIITCHNRKNKTLECLKALTKSVLPDEYAFDVFLVDDGSTDGTSEAVAELYSQVNIIQGDGNLFWNQGMRLAWETASKVKDYDFYFWLNDDTILFKHALNELISCYREAMTKFKVPALITGACKVSSERDEFSYGGRVDSGPVIPNGELQKCRYINGNAVLISDRIFSEIGNLSPEYTHGMGDFDYGLRAQNKGFVCCTTRKYIATCHINEGLPGWCNPKNSLVKRWKLLHSTNGLNIREYNAFRKKFWGLRWIIYAIKAYAKALFPKIYMRISKM